MKWVFSQGPANDPRLNLKRILARLIAQVLSEPSWERSFQPEEAGGLSLFAVTARIQESSAS